LRELRIAIIGGGFMGRAHSLAYSLADIADDLGVKLIKELLVDDNPAVASASGEALGWRQSSTDWHEAVNRPDIDIIDICTPPQFHAPIAIAALKAGKHVLCEKPISNNAAEAISMCEEARRAGVVTQVGFNYRHTPAVAFARKLLDEGKLGVPLEFRASYLQEGSFYADPDRWRARRATGGSGTVGDIGSHIIDVSEYLLGDIKQVAALVRTLEPQEKAGWVKNASEDELDDAGVWVAEYADGTIGSFAVSSAASGRKNRYYYALDCTKGAVEFDWNRREEFRVSYVDEAKDHLGFRTIHTNNLHPGGWWRLAGLGTGYPDVSAIQIQGFVRAIVSGGVARPGFADATHTQQVVDAIHQAARERSWVEVPPRQRGC